MTIIQTSNTDQCKAFRIQPFESAMSTIEVERRAKYDSKHLPPSEVHFPSFHGTAGEAVQFRIALREALKIADHLDNDEFDEAAKLVS